MTHGQHRHPSHLQPGDVVNGWRVLEREKDGGFGVIYRVEMEGQRAAMKFLHHRPVSEESPNADARAVQCEVAALVRLAHLPNVVRFLGCGRYPHPFDGHFFLVMEYVEGDNLDTWAARHNPPFREVARVLAALALTLADAHQQGILHRDISPGNILVARDGRPVLLDFGLSHHALSRPLTQGPRPLGTRNYRSPEAVRFLRLNAKNPAARYEFQPTDDLYSLGVCAWEMLTGRFLFYPHQPETLLNAEIEQRAVPLAHHVNKRVPPALGNIVQRLLAKEPHERYPSGLVLHRELMELAALEDGALDKLVHAPGEPQAPAPVAAKEPPAQQPGPESVSLAKPPTTLPAARHLRESLGAVSVVLLVLAVVVVAAVSSPAAREAPLDSAPAAAPPLALTPITPQATPPTDPNPMLPASPQKEGPTVKARNAPAESPSVSPAPVSAKKPASTGNLLTRCALTFGTLAWLELGCAGVQTRPSPGECPEGAAESMKKLGWDTADVGQLGVSIHLDENRPYGREQKLGFYHSGPIVSSLRREAGNPPLGTRLYGQLWMDEKERQVWGRWTQAEVNGQRVPVCLVLDRDGNTPWDVDSKGRDEVEMFRVQELFPVKRWP